MSQQSLILTCSMRQFCSCVYGSEFHIFAPHSESVYKSKRSAFNKDALHVDPDGRLLPTRYVSPSHRERRWRNTRNDGKVLWVLVWPGGKQIQKVVGSIPGDDVKWRTLKTPFKLVIRHTNASTATCTNSRNFILSSNILVRNQMDRRTDRQADRRARPWM